MTQASSDFAVLVFDMSKTGDPEGERIVAGFRDEATAQAYAEARVRDSIEELRKPGIPTAELSTLWHVYGEDCVVLGGSYRGSHHLARYLVTPATPGERAWSSLTPRARRFLATVLISNADGESVWAGGFFSQLGRPKPHDLLARYDHDARESFRSKGIEPAEPASVHVAKLHELLDPPRPPAGAALTNWKVTVDFVCHDIKFGYKSDGVFGWPEKPQDGPLREMARVVVSDAISLRGDDPSYVDYSDFLSVEVEPTDQPSEYPLD
jgi:hypothetical protein